MRRTVALKVVNKLPHELTLDNYNVEEEKSTLEYDLFCQAEKSTPEYDLFCQNIGHSNRKCDRELQLTVTRISIKGADY